MGEDRLTPAEIHSLLGGGLPEDEDSAIQPKGVAREVVSPLEPPLVAGLRRIHDDFCRRLGLALSDLLRTEIRPRVVVIEARQWDDFCGDVSSPTCVASMQAEGLGADAVLHLSPTILFPLIDRLLGGSGQVSSPLPRRSLTQIEQRLASRIVDAAAAALSTAFSAAIAVQFAVQRLEDELRNTAIVVPAETMVIVECEITLGSARGTMHICMPLRAIEPHRTRLEGVATAPRGLQIEVAAQLAETTITPDELASLEVGDIITTPHSATDPVVVTVEGAPKFRARLGRDQGRLAVEIEERQ